MITKRGNVKKQFLDYVVNNFFEKYENDVALPLADDFLDFLGAMQRWDPKGFKMFMASLIYDCYEFLQWEKICNSTYKKEDIILKGLDNSTNLDQAINSVLTEEIINFFLVSIYDVCAQTLDNKINAKNYFRYAKLNNVIVKSDELALSYNYTFYKKGYIFNVLYNKDQYIQLYKALTNDCKDKNKVFTTFVKIISGMKYYNELNYTNLILDMCEEFMFQKYICGEYNEDNIKEQTMLELIERNSVRSILECVSSNLNLKEALVNAYADYDRFDNEGRKQLHALPLESNAHTIVKKLQYGKKHI